MARKKTKPISNERQLRLFVERVQELSETRLMKENMLGNYKPTFTWSRGEEMIAGGKEPDEEALRSFLLTFRQFISKTESIHFTNVCDTAYQLLKPEYHDKRTFINDARVAWQKSLDGFGQMKIDRVVLHPEDILDMYINGRYFHNDPDYADQLKEWGKYPIRLDKMQFFFVLQDLTNVINQVGNLVAYGSNHNWFDFSDRKQFY